MIGIGNMINPSNTLPRLSDTKKQVDHMQELFYQISRSYFIEHEENPWMFEFIQEKSPRETSLSFPQPFVPRPAQIPFKDFNPRNTSKDTIELLVC
jgi:hypothetical protein